jgi:hypothetical protein
MSEDEKRKKNIVTLFGRPDELVRIKQFCQEEGLYVGRFLVRVAIRHIDEVESERLRKAVNRITKTGD